MFFSPAFKRGKGLRDQAEALARDRVKMDLKELSARITATCRRIGHGDRSRVYLIFTYQASMYSSVSYTILAGQIWLH